MPPAASVSAGLMLALACALAMASKYLLAFHKKHVFNPAAFGVAVTGLVFGGYASWWVGGNLATPAVCPHRGARHCAQAAAL